MPKSDNKPMIFVSHTTYDFELMTKVSANIKEVFGDKFEVFCTFQNSLSAGEVRGQELKNKLKECQYMIAFVSDSYMRSLVCITEFSAFWFKEDSSSEEHCKLIPIVLNGQRGLDFISSITGEDRIAVMSPASADGVDPQKLDETLSMLVKTLNERIFRHCKDAEPLPDNNKTHDRRLECLKEWLSTPQGSADKPNEKLAPRPYIGSDDVYENVLSYCMRSGIKRVQSKGLGGNEISQKLSNMKEIYLVGTTQKTMIEANIDTFSEAVSKGAELYVLIGNRNSPFIHDLADLELLPSGFDDYSSMEEKAENEMRRLAQEFDAVSANLIRLCKDARKKNDKLRENDNNAPEIGKVFLGNASTLIRQTITLGLNKKINKLWAWVSVTTPPKRASDGTLSIEIEDQEDNNSKTVTLAESLKEHVSELAALARLRGELREIRENSKIEAFPGKIFLDEQKNIWENYCIAATKNMLHKCNKDYRSVLIEVAGQHPLKGSAPGHAYEQRLNHAATLYSKFIRDGFSCNIYVPGSVHLIENGPDKGKPEPCSISQAGVQWLIQNGIPEEDIISPDVNDRGGIGVYNSADECAVAAKLFLEGRYDRLVCVCSANQMMRKKLFYYMAGVIAGFYTVPDDDFHSDMYELLTAIPEILTTCDDWQDTSSHHFIRTRLSRKPGFSNDPE